MDVSDPLLKHRLDAVDACRRALAELGPREAAVLQDVQRAMPLFVVVGNQSAGKSSVLQRISGVKLPQANKRCTRLPIVLQIRRVDVAERTQVTLTGPAGVRERFSTHQSVVADGASSMGSTQARVGAGASVDDHDDHDDDDEDDEDEEEAAASDEGGVDGELDEGVAAAIDAAQKRAVELAGSEFAKGYTVEVLIRRPNVPNVSLCDLPGFFDAGAAEKDLEAAVVSMSEQYIKMEGTLVLHVVGGDQDYGSCLRKTLIEEASRVPGKVSVVSFEQILHVARH